MRQSLHPQNIFIVFHLKCYTSFSCHCYPRSVLLFLYIVYKMRRNFCCLSLLLHSLAEAVSLIHWIQRQNRHISFQSKSCYTKTSFDPRSNSLNLFLNEFDRNNGVFGSQEKGSTVSLSFNSIVIRTGIWIRNVLLLRLLSVSLVLWMELN